MPTVQTRDVQTYYERRGSGPTLVLVHASVLDHSMWDAQVDALADEYDVVTYDLRGHGRTGGSDRGRYTMATYAEDLRALLDALNVERAVLCGHSMGGNVVQSFAARYPDRVAGLVLAETWGPEIRQRHEWFVRRVMLPGAIPPVRLLGYERMTRFNAWFYERFFAEAGGNMDRVMTVMGEMPTMETAEFAKVMRCMARFHEESADLSGLAVPVLVLYGENTLPFVTAHAEWIAANLPDATVDVIPGAGHGANLDDPAAYSAAVRGLLARVEADPADRQDPTVSHDTAGMA